VQQPGHPANLRLRLTVAEMNYASRRMDELQALWISEDISQH
jgi:hypothetical protein